MKEKKYVSDYITVKDIENWKKGSIITIKAGTGLGKSHFIKYTLTEYAKQWNLKILMLLSRTNTKDQFEIEIIDSGKSESITLNTYQFVETVISNKGKFNFAQYDFLILDEFQYFLQDAVFNEYTELSLNAILEQSNITRIFTSATGDYMTEYIRDVKKYSTIDYRLPITYDHIQTFNVFHYKYSFSTLIEKFIKENKKAIFFIQKAQDALDLHLKYPEQTIFNCSVSNDRYKFVDKQQIHNMLKNEKFDKPILLTTTAMDAGVNIKDEQLTEIVCDLSDIGTLIQCIGRKRILHESDKINLYVKSWDNRRLGGLKSTYTNKIEKAQYLRKNGEEKFLDKYGDAYDPSLIVYDIVDKYTGEKTKKVNELRYFRYRIMRHEINKMLELGSHGYCKYLAKLFGFYIFKDNFYDYKVIEEERIKVSKHEYLANIVGKKLIKDEKPQLELVNVLNVKDSKNRKKNSISKLNEYLSQNGYNYEIKKKNTSTTVSGKKKDYTYWIVIEKEITD